MKAHTSSIVLDDRPLTKTGYLQKISDVIIYVN